MSNKKPRIKQIERITYRIIFGLSGLSPNPVFGRICNPTVLNIGIYNPAISVVSHYKC